MTQEIIKEMNATYEYNEKKYFKNPEKLLKLASNLSRFSDKEAVKGAVISVVDGYVNDIQNFDQYRLRKEPGYGRLRFPAVENLCEAGFADQAEKILEKGLAKPHVFSNEYIFGLAEKGYFTEDQVKSLLERTGRLG